MPAAYIGAELRFVFFEDIWLVRVNSCVYSFLEANILLLSGLKVILDLHWEGTIIFLFLLGVTQVYRRFFFKGNSGEI